jgi:CheY-like chemotaxis protein
VDDEQVLVYMQQEVLERLGYNVVAVSNSSEALEIFKDDPEIFDLVITDQSMPGLTGIQLSTELLKIRPNIPIILCTGFSETVTREIALETGVKEFLMKPLIKREIAAVIRQVLENQRKESNSEKEE